MNPANHDKDTLTADRLAELAIAALERTAMVLADRLDSAEAPAMPGNARMAQICYSGPAQGRVVLAATDGFLIELSSSLLGVERDEVDLAAQGEDAIRELANIIGGSVILELGGRGCAYSLGLPSLVKPGAAPKSSPGTQQCTLDSEGEFLQVSWFPDASDARAAA